MGLVPQPGLLSHDWLTLVAGADDRLPFTIARSNTRSLEEIVGPPLSKTFSNSGAVGAESDWLLNAGFAKSLRGVSGENHTPRGV